MHSNRRKHLRLGLIIITGATFFISSCRQANLTHEIKGTETGQCLSPIAKMRVSQDGRDAGELLSEACVFTAPNSNEVRVYAWVWTDSLRLSNGNATFVIDENIRAEANGTLIGRFRKGTSAVVLESDDKTSWALLKLIMAGDATKFAIGKGERTRTTSYPKPGAIDWLSRYSEMGVFFVLIIGLFVIEFLKRFAPRIRRFWSG